MVEIRLTNTKTRGKEVFAPIDPQNVRLYLCGPTVYADAHVGHAMSSIVFDFIRRYLQYKRYEVRHVMNFTDLEDQISAEGCLSLYADEAEFRADREHIETEVVEKLGDLDKRAGLWIQPIIALEKIVQEQ